MVYGGFTMLLPVHGIEKKMFLFSSIYQQIVLITGNGDGKEGARVNSIVLQVTQVIVKWIVGLQLYGEKVL